MNLRSLVTCGLVSAVLVLAGCDQGRKAPGKVTVRVADVAPTFAQLLFQRERTSPQTLTFRSAQEVSYDADTYDFHVGAPLLDPAVTSPSWTFTPELKENNGYTFVLTEVAGAVVPVVLEYPNAPANDAQIVALHAGESLPAVDIYLERPGVGIAGATPRGSLAFQGQLTPRTIASGDYEVWVTAAGNPSNVLLASSLFGLPAGVTSVLIITPEGDAGTAALSVTVVQGGSGALYDRNATAELRVINGAADTVPRDFALNHEFSPPLFSAVPAAAPTSYVTVPAGSSQQMSVTPVGNPGVLELDQPFSAFIPTRSTLLFAGDAGVLTSVLVTEDGRHLRGQGNIRFFNAATQFGATLLEFVITEPGGDPTLLLGSANLAAPGASALTPAPPGDYDLYVRNFDTDTNISGPTPIHIDEGGIYGVLAVNGPDTATAAVVLFDDFP